MQILCFRKTQNLFCKNIETIFLDKTRTKQQNKKHPDSTKKYLKLTSTKFPRFILIDVFFNRQSAFLWAQLELLVYLFFYPYEHTSFGGFSMNINDEQFPSTSKNERIPIYFSPQIIENNEKTTIYTE